MPLWSDMSAVQLIVGCNEPARRHDARASHSSGKHGDPSFSILRRDAAARTAISSIRIHRAFSVHRAIGPRHYAPAITNTLPIDRASRGSRAMNRMT